VFVAVALTTEKAGILQRGPAFSILCISNRRLLWIRESRGRVGKGPFAHAIFQQCKELLLPHASFSWASAWAIICPPYATMIKIIIANMEIYGRNILLIVEP
jgi:hypothetical protein